MKIESKIGSNNSPDINIYNFISDFNNFKNLVPADKVKNFESTTEQCTFEVEGMGKTGMQIIEKESPKLIKISAIDSSPLKFQLWIQIKQVAENDTKIKITIEPQVNAMMQMMVKKPLKNFVDSLAEQISAYNFN